jgi:hypothetical protein
MRGDCVEIPQVVHGKSFEVVKLPKRVVGLKPPGAKWGAHYTSVHANTDDTKRVLLFIFNYQKTPIGQLLDS